MLKITLQYTQEDLARGNLFILKRVVKWQRPLRLLSFLSGIGLIVFAFVQPASEWVRFIVVLGLFMVFIAPASWFWWRLLANMTAKRMFENNLYVRNPQTYSFEDDKLTVTGELFDTDLKWEGFFEAAESKTDFFLFLSKDQAYVLPKRFLQGEQESLLRSVLKSRLQDRAKIN